MFCREGVTGLRRVSETEPGYPPVIFVFRGKVQDGEDFFREFWPAAKAIADPTGDLFELFGLFRVKLWQIVGPAAIWGSIQSMLKGYRIGPIGTDPMRSPGLFVLRGDSILWSHEFSHVGDHPDFKTIPLKY